MSRPIIKTRLTLKNKLLILLSTLAILSISIYLYISWSSIPEIIPTHFGFSGEADSFGDKSSLIVLLVIWLSMHLLFVILSRIPQYYNYSVEVTEENAESLYKIGRELMLLLDVEISALFSAILLENLRASYGIIKGINPIIILLFIGCLFITIIVEIIRMNKVKS